MKTKEQIKQDFNEKIKQSSEEICLSMKAHNQWLRDELLEQIEGFEKLIDNSVLVSKAIVSALREQAIHKSDALKDVLELIDEDINSYYEIKLDLIKHEEDLQYQRQLDEKIKALEELKARITGKEKQEEDGI